MSTENTAHRDSWKMYFLWVRVLSPLRKVNVFYRLPVSDKSLFIFFSGSLYKIITFEDNGNRKRMKQS